MIPAPPKRILTFDIECYMNYFLLTVYEQSTGVVVREFEMFNNYIIGHNRSDVDALFKVNTMVSFNGIKYDMPILTAYLNGATNQELKAVSDRLIGERMMPWVFERAYSVKIPKYDHIDLIEVAFGVSSLKIYGAKLRVKKLQELPIHFDNLIMPDQTEMLRHYCINDNVATGALYDDLERAIAIRVKMGKQYGMELRSKSDAQIGEAIMVAEVERVAEIKLPKINPKKTQREFRYTPPVWVYFQNETMRNFLELTKSVTYHLSAKHVLLSPKEFRKSIQLGDKKFQFGIGGIHSIGDNGSFYTDDEYECLQIDVGSFYPRIILNGGFFPPQIGKEAFDIIYRGWCDTRDAAKLRVLELLDLDQLTAEQTEELESLGEAIATIKIILNGIYGKFGSHYSKVFAPGMLMHVTVSGQLALLMLIEQFVNEGIQILSSNTDGITIRMKRGQRDRMNQLVEWWCGVTGFTMDYDEYKSIHYRDVNNYFSHYQNGKIAGIGIFASESLRISPENFIIRDAIFAFVEDGTPIEETVNECEDIHQFITLKKVAGGATKDGVEIGAAIRWYKSILTNTAIHYAKLNCHGTSYNKVANSDQGMPIMDYPDDMMPPADLDREWYIYETYRVMAQTKLLTGQKFYLNEKTNTFLMSAEDQSDRYMEIGVEAFLTGIGMKKSEIKKYGK